VTEDARWQAIANGLDPRLAPAARPQPGDVPPEFPPVPSGQIVRTVIRDLADYQPGT
jgi:hypothetical protein